MAVMERLRVRGGNHYAYADVLRRRADFNPESAALRGREGDDVSYGRLPLEYRADVAGAEYVVYSYGTPIAWTCDGAPWTVPAESYSLTTTRHQNVIRAALDVLDGYVTK